MPILYHYQFSPFSRRVRLALAHKGLDVTLRECRENPAWGEEARKLVPFRTIPVLSDGARSMGDSTAILHWLDAAYPGAPRIWPREPDDANVALQTVALVDVVLGGVIDLGTRYFALRQDASWAGVKHELLGRSRLAADALARSAAASGPNLCKSGWSAAEMALSTLVLWVESWPGRASSSPNIAQLVTLGFELPAELSRWADAHRQRADVLAMG